MAIMVSDHLAHESEFRGQDSVDRRGNKVILLAGVGALGSWLVDLLVRQGYTSLTVLDRDSVEGANFGTQNYGNEDIGRKKATAIATRIFRRLKINVAAIDKELRSSNAKKILGGFGLVIDLFDNVESRMLLKEFCEAQKIPCLHVGMSGDGFSEIEWNENYRAHPPAEVVDQEEPCDYPLASNLVHITVGLAAEVINKFIDGGVKESVHFTLKDMHVHRWPNG